MATEGEIRPEYLKTSEAAKLLRVSARTLYRLAADGGIPACRIGKQYRFSRGDLERFIGKDPTGDTAPLA